MLVCLILIASRMRPEEVQEREKNEVILPTKETTNVKKRKKKKKGQSKPLTCSKGRQIPGVSIKRDPGERGRFLVATNKINAGSILFSEPALVWSAFPGAAGSLCSRCGNPFRKNVKLNCEKCNQVYYCTNECKDRDDIHKKSCDHLSKVSTVASERSVDPTLLTAVIKLISTSTLSQDEIDKVSK